MRPIHRDMKLICSGGRRALGARDYSKKLTGGQDVLQVQANRLCRRGRQQPGLGAHSTLVSCCVMEEQHVLKRTAAALHDLPSH
jgi:hypothetical protein